MPNLTILNADFWEFCYGLQTLDNDKIRAIVVGLLQFDLGGFEYVRFNQQVFHACSVKAIVNTDFYGFLLWIRTFENDSTGFSIKFT